ncbi:hypothetical protein OH492_00530 [Vibrio chagasii]|nr:hypothetical protein [Vibrio chagasii]
MATVLFFTQVFRWLSMPTCTRGITTVNPEVWKQPSVDWLDCGIVGTLGSEDKRYLAETCWLFNRDCRKVTELHVDLSWSTARCYQCERFRVRDPQRWPGRSFCQPLGT